MREEENSLILILIREADFFILIMIENESIQVLMNIG